MIEVIYWLAVVLGIAGAFMGSRASLPLLASVALSFVLEATGAHFETGIWVAIDICVIVTILTFRERASDWIIVGLFPVIWAMYFMPPWVAYNGVSLLMAMQLIFTLPWRRIGHRVAKTAPRVTLDDIFHLRVGALWLDRKA